MRLNFLAYLLVLVLGVASGYAQSIQVSRTPQAPVMMIEEVFSVAKNDTVTTDTVTTGVINLRGTIYHPTVDSTHRFVGYIESRFDTCTYVVQYQATNPQGGTPAGAAWTALVASTQVLPNFFVGFQAVLPLHTQYVRLRIIRGKASTQRVNNTTKVYFYRY